jgi:hypothetical protein
MIREEDKPAWRNFWLKVVPFLVAVAVSFRAGVEMSKQGIRSLISLPLGGYLGRSGDVKFCTLRGVQWLTQFLTADAHVAASPYWRRLAGQLRLSRRQLLA